MGHALTAADAWAGTPAPGQGRDRCVPQCPHLESGGEATAPPTGLRCASVPWHRGRRASGTQHALGQRGLVVSTTAPPRSSRSSPPRTPPRRRGRPVRSPSGAKRVRAPRHGSSSNSRRHLPGDRRSVRAVTSAPPSASESRAAALLRPRASPRQGWRVLGRPTHPSPAGLPPEQGATRAARWLCQVRSRLALLPSRRPRQGDALNAGGVPRCPSSVLLVPGAPDTAGHTSATHARTEAADTGEAGAALGAGGRRAPHFGSTVSEQGPSRPPLRARLCGQQVPLVRRDAESAGSFPAARQVRW